MSVLGKKWVIKNDNPELSVMEKILINRNFLGDDAQNFLHDPFLFKDMQKAVERINSAIEKNERIIIFGDYDVDGITGTAILVHILKKLNANVSYRLPNRLEDGYGLSKKFIDDFVVKNIKLLITVDCGISCDEIIKDAKNKGIETIVTDHHTLPKQLPDDAHAILHPKEKDSNYPFPDLTGAGVAFKLAHALIKTNLKKEEHEEILNSFIDLASLGTIADLGPLKGENWYIVKKGLQILNETKWVGLRKIIELSSAKQKVIDTETIGYRIAPRINAAGRIGDPYIALSLLLQEDESEKVNFLGSKLEELNTRRQEMTLESLGEVDASINEKGELKYILIAENPNWHVGILGLVAGRLTEKYARPSIIMQDFGDTLVASARSPEYFNIVEALTALSHHLISFGGHAQAAGFNIKKENLDAFKNEMEKYAEGKLKEVDLKPKLEIDCEIADNEVGFDLLDKLEKLKPFGIANEKPVFLMQGIEPYFIDQVGKSKDHLKFSIKVKEKNIQVVAFRMGSFAEDLRQHRKIDLVFHIERNNWNNQESLQFQALDFRESKK